MITSLFGWRATTLGLLLAAIGASTAVAKPADAPGLSKAPGAPASVKAAAAASRHAAGGSSSVQTRVPGSPKSGVDTSACQQVSFTQPFASFGDSHLYTLMPGQAVADFTGAGWTLSGGASIVDTTVGGGAAGRVLDLPSGSTAVSPPMCVASDYPTSRAMIRDVTGHAGVHFAVSYEGTKTWARPRTTGLLHSNSSSWALSKRVGVKPSKAAGWQIVRFRLSVGTAPGEYQLYNLYVDPFMRK